MTSERRVEEWESRYRSGVTGWDRGGSSPSLRLWLKSGGLRREADSKPLRVLIPGAGRGHEAVELAAAGYAVTAVDIAPSAIRHLRQSLAEAGAQAQVIQADLLHWEPAQAFDAIYEQTSLCALSPEHWDDYARRLHRWLRPGGEMFALFMQTGRDGGPPYHCEIGRMHKLFPAEAWEWQRELGRVPHPNGLDEIATVLRRR